MASSEIESTRDCLLQTALVWKYMSWYFRSVSWNARPNSHSSARLQNIVFNMTFVNPWRTDRHAKRKLNFGIKFITVYDGLRLFFQLLLYFKFYRLHITCAFLFDYKAKDYKYQMLEPTREEYLLRQSNVFLLPQCCRCSPTRSSGTPPHW